MLLTFILIIGPGFKYISSERQKKLKIWLIPV